MLLQVASLSSKPDDILESNTDAAEWNLEVERVLPQLKVTIRTDNKVRSVNASKHILGKTQSRMKLATTTF